MTATVWSGQCGGQGVAAEVWSGCVVGRGGEGVTDVAFSLPIAV